MKFDKAINEGLTNPVGIKLVKQAVQALGKRASRNKIKEYIKTNLVNNPRHFKGNEEFIDGAIDSLKNGNL